MNFRRHAIRTALAASLLAASTLAPAAPLGGFASASVPDTSVDGTQTSEPAGTDPAQTDVATPAPEIVQSWTLTTGGGTDGSEPGSRPNFTYQVQPGAVIEDTVVLYNLGNVPLEFRVYATDAFNNADGQFDLLPGDDVPVDAGSWVQLVQERIILEPNKQATIPFTMTVPVDRETTSARSSPAASRPRTPAAGR